MNRPALVGAAVVLLAGLALWWSSTAGETARREQASVASSDRAAAGTQVATANPEPAPVREEASATPVGWHLAGHVHDASDRAPVPGALVSVRMDFGSDSERLLEVRSDAEGAFAADLEPLRTLPPLDLEHVRVALAVSAEGRCGTYARVALPHRDPRLPMSLLKDLELVRGAVVLGRIVSDRRAPVANAEVELRCEGTADPTARATSDDAGGYRMAPRSGGRARLRAHHHSFGTAEVEVHLDVGRDVTASDLVLLPQHTVKGRVTFDDGEPAAGVEIALFAEDAAKDAPAAATPMTGPDGRFTAATLQPGRYRLWPGYGLDRAIPAAARGWPMLSTDANEAHIVLAAVHQVRIRFEDDAGRPLHVSDVAYRAWRSQDAAALRALRDGVPLPREVQERRIAYATGHLRSPCLIDRGYWAWVQASVGTSHGEVLVEAAPPRNVLDAVLRLRARAPTATLRVLLRAGDGGPVSDFDVQLQQIRLGEADVWELQQERTGQGLVCRAPPGRYLAQITPKTRNADLDFGSFDRFEQEVELRADAETTLERTVAIGGRIRFCVRLSDATEQRQIEDCVIGTMPGGQWVAGRSSFVKKLPNGWELGSQVTAGQPLLWETLLPAGRHELTVRSRDYQDAVVGVTISPRTVTDVDIWLQPR